MQWSLSDLLNLPNGHLEFQEEMDFKPEDLVRFKRIRNITKASVSGSGHYEPSQNRLYLNLNIQGEMIVPCDITLEDVVLPFSTKEDVVYSLVEDSDPDIYPSVNGVVDTLPTVLQLIYLEIPLKVVKEGIVDYPKGENWEVIKEEEYERSKKEQPDSRLEKLKDYIPKD